MDLFIYCLFRIGYNCISYFIYFLGTLPEILFLKIPSSMPLNAHTATRRIGWQKDKKPVRRFSRVLFVEKKKTCVDQMIFGRRENYIWKKKNENKTATVILWIYEKVLENVKNFKVWFLINIFFYTVMGQWVMNFFGIKFLFLTSTDLDGDWLLQISVIWRKSLPHNFF